MFHWHRDYLDVILVPCGLLLMVGYHLILVYRYLKRPKTTVIGYENHNKTAWVIYMFKIDVKDRGTGVSVISSNITAATALASISLLLSSLMGTWIGSSTIKLFTNRYIYGSRSVSMVYAKYVAVLACFLVAFVCFVHSVRHFVHANFLISMPNNNSNNNPVICGYAVKEVIKGSNYWMIGLRSLYLATNLLLWIFGPIPMFLCSVIMVVVLLKLDSNTTPLHHYNHEFLSDSDKTN